MLRHPFEGAFVMSKYFNYINLPQNSCLYYTCPWEVRKLKKYRVNFKFEKDNSTTAFIEAENENTLFDKIISNKEWFRFEDENTGIVHVVNMQLVNTFNIFEYKDPSISVL